MPFSNVSSSSSNSKDSAVEEEVASNSLEGDPLTNAISRLVNQAKLLSTEQRPPRRELSSPSQSPSRVAQSQELDSILNNLEKWSSVPGAPPPPAEESAAKDSEENGNYGLPAKGFFEKCVDVVDRITGGADETFASESKLTRLFSRPDSTGSKPDPPGDPQLAKRLSVGARKFTTLRNQTAKSAMDKSKPKPKIEIHRPASLRSMESGSESARGFLSRLLWGKGPTHEEKIESEINDWVQAKEENLVAETEEPETMPPAHRDSTPKISRVIPAQQDWLNAIDNFVTQMRLTDEAEKGRIRRERDVMARSVY
eukprot:Gregarina_sp_Poly_1__6262@NODE_3322_length_1184_cov_110_615936_g1007_i1_p1_GENE_NODE_3322_length_1184_cov_110_615936_g1007_i1NODE_3322_length_1184_cov_110_615936_g1007_i1_p1_ORF_typecomplete_len312_score47_49ICA69/PF04629_14/0_95ICA69/PF04629_14/5_4e02_NODE_3322_length_1184_cov_110_615936_g1007_i1671002